LAQEDTGEIPYTHDCRESLSRSLCDSHIARYMMLSLFLSSFALGTMELTMKNFDKEVHESGKGAFVKFLAPW